MRGVDPLVDRLLTFVWPPYGLPPEEPLVEVEEEAAPPDVREEAQPRDPSMPRGFDEVVGQEGAVRILRAEVEAAKREGRTFPHILLYGPPGVGKSMLAFVLAEEMGVPLYESSGAEIPTQKETIETLGRVGRLIEQAGRPAIFLIDEADGMARVASYPLHGLMTSGYVRWQGVTYDCSLTTVVATTNYMARMPRALRSRFRHVVFIDFYRPDELAEIVQRAAARAGFALGEGVAEWIGANSAGEPRKALHLLRSVRTLGASTPEEARAALACVGLRHRGLSRPQYDYLSFLAEVGSASLNTLASYLSLDSEDVRGEVEPYLIRSRMAAIGRGGRVTLPAARAYLEEAAQA